MQYDRSGSVEGFDFPLVHYRSVDFLFKLKNNSEFNARAEFPDTNFFQNLP